MGKFIRPVASSLLCHSNDMVEMPTFVSNRTRLSILNELTLSDGVVVRVVIVEDVDEPREAFHWRVTVLRGLVLS